MYYSHTIEDNKIGLFTSFVESLIEGRQEHRPIVNHVIKETHDLALGKKNIYTIDRDSYPVVVLLEKRDSDFFKTVDPNNATPDLYRKILGILSEQRNYSFY